MTPDERRAVLAAIEAAAGDPEKLDAIQREVLPAILQALAAPRTMTVRDYIEKVLMFDEQEEP